MSWPEKLHIFLHAQIWIFQIWRSITFVIFLPCLSDFDLFSFLLLTLSILRFNIVIITFYMSIF